jgi:hypothetical protein
VAARAPTPNRSTTPAKGRPRREGLTHPGPLQKRMIYDDFKRLSANRSEHEDIDRATHKLRRALAEVGFDPR